LLGTRDESMVVIRRPGFFNGMNQATRHVGE
jgi:hypothetical protein